jgi:enamine deaminase RidA (YjgF/YER057c/UK114 family)
MLRGAQYMSAEERIKELGLSLPSGSAPAANYANAVRSGNLLFIAGKAPLSEDGKLPRGKLGRQFTVDEGYRFARSAAIDLIAVARSELGSLDRVVRVVEVQGFVNATEEFENHAQVLNGCSDLLVEVFGERGVHARSVVGANSLRGGVPVIVKAIIEIDPS